MQTTELFDLRVSKHPEFRPVHKAVLVGRWGGALIYMSSGESARVSGAFLMFPPRLLLW